MRRYALSLLVAALLLVAGCGAGDAGTAEPRTEGDAGTTRAGETEPASSTTEGTEETLGTSPEAARGETAPAEREAARGEPPFVADPEASGGAGSGADGILNVRFGLHEGYERAVVDLGAGSDPAETVPEWILESPEGDGLLRVTFPSVGTTAVSDGRSGEELLDGFYVVRAPGGGMFVDFFAREAFVYRVIELSDPARLVVDFKPAGGSLAVPLPARSGNTVLVQPRASARVGDPFTVSGYSRNFEASNTVVLLGASGQILAQKTVLGNDWSETWGYFETNVDRLALGGGGTLQVGAYSARDGSFEGVEISVY